MNRARKAALTASVFAIIFLGIVGAQPAPQETARRVQSAAETSSRLTGLRDQGGALRAVLVSADNGLGLGTIALQESGTWFSSVHPYSSLSEVLSHYQNEFARLGFRGTIKSVSEEITVWTFEKAGRRVSAVFNYQGDDVIANISWL